MKMKQYKFINSKGKYYQDLRLLMARLSIEHEINNHDDTQDTTNKELNFQKGVLCRICSRKKESMYKCPKCNIAYCSIDCYKKHSNDCTEEFYKENVLSELKSTKVNDDEAFKFRRSLKEVYDKLNQLSPDDFNDSENVIEKKKIKHYEGLLDKLNSNTIDIDRDLTPDDWKEFNDFLNSKDKDQDNYGALYFPFWLRDEIPSVYIGDLNYYSTLSSKELNELKELELNDYATYYDNDSKDKGKENDDHSSDDEEEEEEHEIELKTMTLNNKKETIDYNIINKSLYIKYDNIKELTQLAKTEPAKENVYQLIIVVYTTVYLFRLFNGDFYIENDIEVIDYMMAVCPLLYDKVPFTLCHSIHTATDYFVSNLKQMEQKHLMQTMGVVLTDTITLITKSKSFIFESLIRLYEIVHKFGQKSTKNIKGKLNLAKHKLIYLMSYFKSLNADVYNESIQSAFEEYYSSPLINHSII